MALKDRLMDDLKAAMKEKNALKKATITMVRAAVKQTEVDSKTELDDEGVTDIIAKQIKQKRSALEEFQKGGREDLVEEANAEIEVLMAYMPKQLTEEEIRAIVQETIASVGAASPKEMGKVMGALTPKTKGKADNKLVSQIVREMLQP